MNNEETDNLIAQFQHETKLDDPQIAKFYLEAFGWNIDLALSSYEKPGVDISAAPQTDRSKL